MAKPFLRFFFITFLFLLISASHAWGAMELSGNFGYNKMLYGATKQNSLTTRSYTSSIAFYFFNNTAFEINYYNSTNMRLANETYKITGVAEYSVIQSYNEVRYESCGKLRHAFAQGVILLDQGFSGLC